MNFERKSGVLLHITSLPGRWGMGELGVEAREFGAFLAASGQKLWQILPTGPIGYGFSPYSSSSAFAGNPLLISLDELMEDGLLAEDHLKDFPLFDSNQIDFPAVIEARMEILNGVCERFESSAAFEAFCNEAADWLDDYALFSAIREAHQEKPWVDWPAALRDRETRALENAREKYATSIRRHQILQYLFACHWKKTKDYLNGLDIEIVGDLPIFVAGDSADVWANRELFFLEPDGNSSVVAGVPPDYFSKTGQRWGNPLYDWEAHRTSTYAWWTQRMQQTLDLVDVVRIDHFRAFEDYWEIPADEPNAVKGHWVKGPGFEFFQTLEKNLQKMPRFGKLFRLADHVIAEDLGIITDEVDALREACGFPGMTVLQFRFSAEDMQKPNYRPEGCDENSVVYTGTHDNETTHRWFKHLSENERQEVLAYLHTQGPQIHKELVGLALSAPARLAIHPLQDVLGKGKRMNCPGTTMGNWSWRVPKEWLTKKVCQDLLDRTVDAGRHV